MNNLPKYTSNKMPSWLHGLFNKLDTLNTRERALVQYGSIVLGLVIAWLVLISPALTTLQNATTQQEALIQKASKILQLADELENLRATQAPLVTSSQNLQQALNDLLSTNHLTETTQVTRTEEGTYLVNFHGSPAAGVLAWLSALEQSGQVKPIEVDLKKTEAASLDGKVVLSTTSTQGNR